MEEAEADTGELEAVEVDEGLRIQYAVLRELRSIRYRLGVLIFFLIVLPIFTAFVYYAINSD